MPLPFLAAAGVWIWVGGAATAVATAYGAKKAYDYLTKDDKEELTPSVGIYLEGLSGAGKTTLVELIAQKPFSEEYEATVGIKQERFEKFEFTDLLGIQASTSLGGRDDFFEANYETKIYIYVFNCANYISKVGYKKNVDKLLESAKRICERNGKIKFLCLGSHKDLIEDKEKISSLENEIRQKNIKCKVFNLRDTNQRDEVLNFIDKN